MFKSVFLLQLCR